MHVLVAQILILQPIVSNIRIFIVNFIFYIIILIIMTQIYQKAQNPFSTPKSLSQKSNQMNFSNQRPIAQKMNKLSYLREISPKELIGGDSFFENLNEVCKPKSCSKVTSTQQTLSNTSLKFFIQNKKFNSNISNRKESENLSFLHTSAKITIIAPGTERPHCSKEDSAFKIDKSSKALSEKSSNQNISSDYFDDQKSIIKIGQVQQQVNNGPIANYQEKQELAENKQITIDDFEILNFCGEGVFGSVYIARQKKTKSIYALKKISKSKISDQKDKESLIRQIKIHLKLNHPNIIKFYGFFSSEKAIYFILQLSYSGNLYQKMVKNGPLHQNQVKTIIRQVLRALDYLHQKNIIHRDLKAENIIVHENTVKICDFGWASEGSFSRKSLCGTPAYISPEVISNKLYDKKVDVWSLGVLTFELCFGKIPFDIKAEQDFQKIINQELIFPIEIYKSDCCKDFIMKCLQKNSFKRWDTSRLLNHPFMKKEA